LKQFFKTGKSLFESQPKWKLFSLCQEVHSSHSLDV
jgi:hypothetical protein